MEFRQSKEFKDLLDDIGRMMVQTLRTPFYLPSSFLRTMLQYEIDVSKGNIRIFIPVYWARAHLEGRKVAMRKGGKMLWYADPKKDPRNSGGYPSKLSQRKRASYSLIKADLEHDKRIVKALRRSLGRSLTSNDYKNLYRQGSLRLVWADASKATPKHSDKLRYWGVASGSVLQDKLSTFKSMYKKAVIKYIKRTLKTN